MKRVLLTVIFALTFYYGYTQNDLRQRDSPVDQWEWMVRIGLNALDQSYSTSNFIASKSALGFQAGADVIWNPGWKLKGGVQYQYHEVFEINENNNIITANETNGRNFHRLKMTAGTLYDIIQVDYLTIGLGADAAYNFNITNKEDGLTGINNNFDLDYFSALMHLYVNIRKFQIDFGFEGNLFDLVNSQLNPFQSKTYSLTLGYIF